LVVIKIVHLIYSSIIAHLLTKITKFYLNLQSPSSLIQLQPTCYLIFKIGYFLDFCTHQTIPQYFSFFYSIYPNHISLLFLNHHVLNVNANIISLNIDAITLYFWLTFCLDMMNNNFHKFLSLFFMIDCRIIAIMLFNLFIIYHH
jgi:hypothetical protein